MLFYEGLSCPVCKRAFMRDDDVVVCPQCGLPHHRACWQQLSHCQQADKHGTDEQWTREKAEEHPEPQTEADEGFNGKICPSCHTRNKEFAEFCAHCGRTLQSDDWHSAPYEAPPVGEYTPFHSPSGFGEIYTDTEPMGQVTARDMAAVVGQNTAYYLPRFRRIEQGHTGGWNWAAFLLAPYWLLFRKQYLFGTLFLTLQVAYSFLYNFWMPSFDSQVGVTVEQQMAAMKEAMSSHLFVPIMVFSVVILVLEILLGIYGNRLYRRHCEKKILAAREETPDLSSAELTMVGGTSMVAAIIAYFIPVILNNFVALLIQAMR